MLKDDFEKYYPVIKKCLYFILVMALILAAFKLAFAYLLPFVFAFAIAAAMEPFIRLLVRLRLSRNLAILVAMVVYFGLLFTLAFFSISRLIREVSQFFEPHTGVQPGLQRFFQRRHAAWAASSSSGCPRRPSLPCRTRSSPWRPG